MANIGLLVLDRTAWARVAEDPDAFAVEHTLTLGAEPDLLRTVGQQTVAMLKRTGATTPWTGYLGVDRERQIIIGTCASQRLPTLKVSLRSRTSPSRLSRVEVTPVRWRRDLWNSRKALRNPPGAGSHVAGRKRFDADSGEAWL